MRKIFGFVSMLVVMFSLTGRALAVDVFAKPRLDNIFQTLIRMDALDIYNPEIMDLYARVLYCKDYLKYYENDFEWKVKQEEIIKEVKDNINTFPVGYGYETMVKLGRYDFKDKVYKFVGEGGEINVNTFTMKVVDANICKDKKPMWLPYNYKIVLNKPLKMPGLYLSEEEGVALLHRLSKAGNKTHIIFPRINIRIVYVAGLATENELKSLRRSRFSKVLTSDRGTMVVYQDMRDNSITLDGRVESVEFFEDEARTKLIYTYYPM